MVDSGHLLGNDEFAWWQHRQGCKGTSKCCFKSLMRGGGEAMMERKGRSEGVICGKLGPEVVKSAGGGFSHHGVMFQMVSGVVGTVGYSHIL